MMMMTMMINPFLLTRPTITNISTMGAAKAGIPGQHDQLRPPPDLLCGARVAESLYVKSSSSSAGGLWNGKLAD